MKLHCIDECKSCCGTGRNLETLETCSECNGNGIVDIFIPVEVITLADIKKNSGTMKLLNCKDT